MLHTVPGLRPFLEVGNKVQMKPREGSYWRFLEDRTATIARIEVLPDPEFLDIQTQEDWEDYLRIRVVSFLVKVDDCSGLPDYFKDHEVMFRDRELQPVPPRMTKQQLAQYCQQRLREERDEHRCEAYLQVMRHLQGQPLSFPLVPLDAGISPGHQIDLINLFIRWAARLRNVAQEIVGMDQASSSASRYEAQAQVFDELGQKLLPRQRALASLMW